jgi:hypothetical protein
VAISSVRRTACAVRAQRLSVEIGGGAGLRFVPFFRSRNAIEIHDFRAHFGPKNPFNNASRHGKFGLNKQVDILANTCFVWANRAIKCRPNSPKK